MDITAEIQRKILDLKEWLDTQTFSEQKKDHLIGAIHNLEMELNNIEILLMRK